MVKCPRCDLEFVDSISVCPACKVAVVPAEPEFVVVYEPPNEIALGTARSILEGEGIEVAVQLENVPWLDGIFGMIAGRYARVLVAEQDEANAKEIIGALVEAGYLPPGASDEAGS